MRRQRQKQEEREAFETFLDVLVVEHTGFNPGEAPDFVLSRPTGRTGVELVRTTVRQLEQQATNNARFKAKLERALYSRGVGVSVSLAPHTSHPGLTAMPKRESDRACDQIVDLVAMVSRELEATNEHIRHVRLVSLPGPPPHFIPIQPRARIAGLRRLTVCRGGDREVNVEFTGRASRLGGGSSDNPGACG